MTDNGYLVNYEINGHRHLYYERSDGSNLLKLDSAVATLTYDATNNTILFNFDAQTSNILMTSQTRVLVEKD